MKKFVQHNMNNKKNSGISLLELLVVIIIVSMVSTLLMQGFAYMMMKYQWIDQQQHSVNRQILSRYWFEQVNKHLVPNHNAGQALQGDAQQISTTSFNPLINNAGVPTAIHWQLQQKAQQTILYYNEASSQDSIAIMQWSAAQAEFSYLDNQQQWHYQWPLSAEDIYLPEAIKLSVKSIEEEFQQIVYRQTRPSPQVNLDELLYGR